jgi:predicted nucleic acid-binding Zn ribbon protein
MYCPYCGTENEDIAATCSNCNENIQNIEVKTTEAISIPNYLVQSILITIFCCLPFGIVSIIFAAQVNGEIKAGNIEKAQECSRKAKLWSWWGFGIGIVSTVLWIIIQIILLTFGAYAESW